jgi:hypothetical protein
VTAFLPLAQAEWGTVPDWLEAIGTLAAFAVALRLLAKELAARREAEDDRRSEQARRVAVWALWVSRSPPRHELFVRNNSDELVSAVSLVMEHPDEPGIVTREESVDLLPPGWNQQEGGPRGHPPGPITLTFTDAAGCRWTRYPDGRLVELKRPRRSRKDYMNAWIANELDHLDY